MPVTRALTERVFSLPKQPIRDKPANPHRRKLIEDLMFPTPKPSLTPNTYAYESSPLVKPTGFREYDARWLLEKEINLMGVQALGMGLGTLIAEPGVKQEIVTGHDFRSYSAAVKM